MSSRKVKHGQQRTRKARHAGHHLSNEDIENVRLSLLGVVATCELVRSSFAASRCTGIVLTRGAQPSRIGTVLEIDDGQAAIVREIFTRFAEGASCLAVARELNARGVPSSGSTWKRKTRRCTGWMASAVRVILRNPLYCAWMRWNVSQFVRDPDSGKHKRRRRPKVEWVEHRDEALRIIPEELYDRAQARTRVAANSDKRLKSGGRAKYLLSGLLVCNVCKAHCSNHIRVRRDLLAPGRVGGNVPGDD